MGRPPPKRRDLSPAELDAMVRESKSLTADTRRLLERSRSAMSDSQRLRLRTEDTRRKVEVIRNSDRNKNRVAKEKAAEETETEPPKVA